MNNIKQTKAVVTSPSKCYVGYSTILDTGLRQVTITTSSITDMVVIAERLMGYDFELDQSKVQKVAIFDSNKIIEVE